MKTIVFICFMTGVFYYLGIQYTLLVLVNCILWLLADGLEIIYHRLYEILEKLEEIRDKL